MPRSFVYVTAQVFAINCYLAHLDLLQDPVQALEGPRAMLLEAAALVAAYITLHGAHSAAMHTDTVRMRAMRLPHWSRMWAFAQAFDCSRQVDLQKQKDIELATTLMQATSTGEPLGRCHREAMALLALPPGPSNPTLPCPDQTATTPASAQTNRTPDEAFIRDDIRPLTERAPGLTDPDLTDEGWLQEEQTGTQIQLPHRRHNETDSDDEASLNGDSPCPHKRRRVECHREPQPRTGTTAVTYQPQDTDSDDEAWLRTDIPDPRQKHSNKRTPAVLLNEPAYPLDTHTQPPHKRPCTSQHICATPEPQPNTVPHGHPTDPSNDAEANGDSSLRRVS